MAEHLSVLCGVQTQDRRSLSQRADAPLGER